MHHGSRIAIVALLVAMVACPSPSPLIGAEDGPCDPDGLCDPGLECARDLCVRPPNEGEGEAEGEGEGEGEGEPGEGEGEGEGEPGEGEGEGEEVLSIPLAERFVAADLPTLAFDVTHDVLALVSNGGSGEPETISGEFGGSADVAGVLTGPELDGWVAFTDFLTRQGFPSFEAGRFTFTFTFTVSASSLIGTITSEGLVIDDEPVDLVVTYDLWKESPDAVFWRGMMNGTLAVGGNTTEFEYDYDTPIITAIDIVRVEAGGNEVALEPPGTLDVPPEGATVRMKLAANSNAAPGWIQNRWESPAGNLEGGGNGVTYCRVQPDGSPCASTNQWEFREMSYGYWIFARDFFIPPGLPSGDFTWTHAVSNTAELTSRDAAITVAVTTPAVPVDAPVIVLAVLETQGLDSGTGGTVTLHLVAESESPIAFLSNTVDGPSRNVEGGGMGVAFEDCALHASEPAHPCNNTGSVTGLPSSYYSRTWQFSEWAENGTYTFSNVVVTNQAMQDSEPAPQLQFTIANNAIATTPVITEVDLVSFLAGQDPVLDGGQLNGMCVDADVAPDPLRFAMIVRASSNAPISFLTLSLDGPAGNLIGGGTGQFPIDLGGGLWQVDFRYALGEPVNAPWGSYSISNVTVDNEGQRQSAAWAGSLAFELLDTCP